MIKSMTGFGRCRTVLHGREISVEIKSVNHRFLNFHAELQRATVFLTINSRLL